MDRSKVVNFFRDQSVLVTGATGFVGKATVEKLLRVCKPKEIILLVRPKKGRTPEERVEQLFQEKVFERMKLEVSDFRKSVTAVEGDFSKSGLGLSNDSRDLLIDRVTVVLHGAATVRFDEKLKTAIDVNVRGTKEVIQLCREIKNLKAVTHVSTAYSYCKYKYIEEKFYEPPVKADCLIAMSEAFEDERLEAITPSLLGEWPNTYAFTKAVAENVVETSGKDLPIALYRPAIVIGAKEEPIKGWIDNTYGPTGVLAGAGAGLMRTLYAGPDCIAEMIPVDMTVNALLTITFETSLRRPGSQVKIFNFVSSNQNPFTWGGLLDKCMKYGKEAPSVKSLYYYTFTLTSNKVLFFIYCSLYHLLPALIADGVLTIMRKERMFLRLYSKIHKFSSVIGYFCTNVWKFENNNTLQLLSNMGEEDRELFDFDIAKMDWDEFCKHNVKAIRVYILQDPLDTIPRGRIRFFWLHILHRVVQISSIIFVLWALTFLYFIASTYIFSSSATLDPVQ